MTVQGLWFCQARFLPEPADPDYFEVSKDFVLSVDLTPNRVDASSYECGT